MVAMVGRRVLSYEGLKSFVEGNYKETEDFRGV